MPCQTSRSTNSELSMMDVEHIDGDENNQWLIRQFETYRFNGLALEDKFIPRPYISILFHFKERPFIADESPLKLEPYFVAPIIPKAITLKFHGSMDTLTAPGFPSRVGSHGGSQRSTCANRLFLGFYQFGTGINLSSGCRGYALRENNRKEYHHSTERNHGRVSRQQEHPLEEIREAHRGLPESTRTHRSDRLFVEENKG